jgi:hypothetical protein
MDTQELFERAKKDLIAEGKHAPVMYVEFTDKTGAVNLQMYYFADFGAETALQEKMHFFALGAKFGEEHGQVDFTCLTFICEAWVSSVKPGEKRKFRRPEDDPNRRECLMAQIVKIQPAPGGKPAAAQSVLRAEMVRPAPGIIDLVQDDNTEGFPSMLFPTYFMSGYSSSQRSPEEIAAIYSKHFDNRRGS